jgi:hypothetical protein
MTRILWTPRRIRRAAFIAPVVLSAFVLVVSIPRYFLNRVARP